MPVLTETTATVHVQDFHLIPLFSNKDACPVRRPGRACATKPEPIFSCGASVLYYSILPFLYVVPNLLTLYRHPIPFDIASLF